MAQIQPGLFEGANEAKRRLAEKLLRKGSVAEYRALTGKKTVERTGTPTAIDLFCGCGGASLGFINADWNVIAGLDLADDALKTYQLNLGGAIKGDVRFLPFRPLLEPDLVIAGPPCQGFSRMNRYRHKEFYRKQRGLLKFFALAVEYLKPKLLMFENIPDVQRYPEFRWMVNFLKRETQPPYCLNYDVLDAADYGVPQHRKRLILLGRRVDGYLVAEMEPFWTVPRNPPRSITAQRCTC